MADQKMTEQEILLKAWNTYGGKRQMEVMIEEMAELTQALIKWRRYRTPLRLQAVREEIADVGIMLDQMRMIFGDTGEWRQNKLARLEARLSGQTEETV